MTNLDLENRSQVPRKVQVKRNDISILRNRSSVKNSGLFRTKKKRILDSF